MYPDPQKGYFVDVIRPKVVRFPRTLSSFQIRKSVSKEISKEQMRAAEIRERTTEVTYHLAPSLINFL